MSQLTLQESNFQEKETLFADIALPVPVPRLYTYRVPFEMAQAIQTGSRVIVQFGAKKILTGVVVSLANTPPEGHQAKYILELLGDGPVINPIQLRLFDWCAQYYLCTLGEVLNLALPSGLKLSSQSKVQLNPVFDEETTECTFTDRELQLLTALRNNNALGYEEVADLLDVKSAYHIIKSLITKEAVLLFEEVKDRYKPRVEKRLRLQPAYANDHTKLEALFEQLEKRPAQTDVLLQYLQQVPVYQAPERNAAGVPRKMLTDAGASTSSIGTLIKNGVLEAFEVVVSRFDLSGHQPQAPSELNEAQQIAKSQILQAFEQQNIVLFHGITGSGKTEVYIELIQAALNNGDQVLYLLPEIALTTQIVKRLQQVFGTQMGIYHSRYSDNERVEVWNGVINGTFPLVVGVRSAVFLPFDNLGLVIVDEEHEFSYKAFEPAPRYHGRDMALVLASVHHAKALLGSATPAFESYYLAQQKRYGYVALHERFGDAVLPQIKLVDVVKERKAKTLKGDFTQTLLDALTATIEKDEQAIIFQNKRGYAPYLLCEECGHIPKCVQCAVSLTYHMYSNELRCHYCGYSEAVPAVCPSCSSTRQRLVGFGTEKLEEDLKLLLPQARIQRMDLDTTRSKYGYQKIIDAFEAGDIDILVGTQMVSKGLDFDKVSLVGVLDVDRMIHWPDFRSHERAYQLITQVSGRAGRRKEQGLVLIQTNNTEQPLLHQVMSGNYEGLYRQEIVERMGYNYPPFTRMVKLVVKHEDKEVAETAAKTLATLLLSIVGQKRLLGPQEPLINKIRNRYLMDIFIKLERDSPHLKQFKQMIKEQIEALTSQKDYRKVLVAIDADPY